MIDPELQDVPQIYTVVRQTFLSRRPDVNAQLITLSSLFVLAAGCSVYWNYDSADALMNATHEAVFTRHEFWRLWTTVFAHADLGHLLSNSLMFFILGYFLSGYFGAFVFPFMALVMGGVTNALSLYTYAPEVRLVGASGVVSWMGGAWLILYFLINTNISRTGRALRSFGVALLLFAPAEAFDPKISYRTHVIGFVLGAAWGALYYRHRRAEFKAAEIRETKID